MCYRLLRRRRKRELAKPPTAAIIPRYQAQVNGSSGKVRLRRAAFFAAPRARDTEDRYRANAASVGPFQFAPDQESVNAGIWPLR